MAFQAAFLLVMLSLIVLAMGSAERSFMGVHPITPVIVVAHLVGLSLSRRVDRDDQVGLAAADITAPGSIFEQAGDSALLLAGLAMLLNAILLAGLVRQGDGARDVEVESIANAGVWCLGVAALVVGV